MKYLAAIFTGTGVGILIIPAFAPEIALWNLLGFILVAPGFYFMGKALEKP